MADDSGTGRRAATLKPVALRRSALGWAIGTAVLTALFLAALLTLSSRFPMSWDWFVPLSLLLGALLGLVFLWKGPQWQVGRVKGLNRKERFDSENEARKTLATILGGIVLLGGGYATWRNIKLAQESLKTSQKALSVAQEGQITDRFTKAIEQLGAVNADGVKKMVVRLGGIYALERIANESERDHWPIMEVLCTYVRNVAPIKPQSTKKKQQSSQRPKSPVDEHPEADVQAILTVLGRRDRKYEKQSEQLDLAKTDLTRVDLFIADLRWASLIGSNLSGAKLIGAELSGANLSGADLMGAELSTANLSGADLNLVENLTQQQIDEAIGDRNTMLPPQPARARKLERSKTT